MGDQGIRVVFSESEFGHEGRVMRLEYAKPKKSFWKRT
jgi:hypothetical protein